MSPTEPLLHVGCAMWSLKHWVGTYLPSGSNRRDDLAAYGSWCTAVEGNTTFYATPKADTVERWAEAAPDGFQFCFKLPKAITHDRRLRNCDDEVAEFLERMRPLGDHLGPVWIQLPPSFGPDELDALDTFCASVPSDIAWGVELRHRAFEADGAAERTVNDLLHARGVDRVLIDTRAVFDGPCVTEAEIDAFEKKPRLKVRPVALHQRPMVRFIGQTDPAANPAYWAPWIPKVVSWIEEGRSPLVFIHTPDNVVAPTLARLFYEQIRELVPALAPLPEPRENDLQLPMF